MKTKKIKPTEFDFRTITSYEDACKKEKIDPVKSLPDVSKCPKFLQKYITAAYKLAVINEAIRNGDKLNYNDKNEYKYEPWHIVKADSKHPAGFGFSGSNCDRWRTTTIVGSRLANLSREKAIYLAENFHDLWIDYKLEID